LQMEAVDEWFDLLKTDAAIATQPVVNNAPHEHEHDVEINLHVMWRSMWICRSIILKIEEVESSEQDAVWKRSSGPPSFQTASCSEEILFFWRAQKRWRTYKNVWNKKVLPSVSWTETGCSEFLQIRCEVDKNCGDGQTSGLSLVSHLGFWREGSCWARHDHELIPFGVLPSMQVLPCGC
jgi:hypothetical protein